MARFELTAINSQPGSLMPRLSLELSVGSNSLQTNGIVDTGSAVNVLPYHIGIELGAVWNRTMQLGQLTGGMAGLEARALALSGFFPDISNAAAVPLLFAWTESDSVPVLLGQTNFLQEFNVCFYRSQYMFEVWRA